MAMKTIDCLACGNEMEVDHDIASGVCGVCMAVLAGPGAAPSTQRSNGEPKIPKMTKAGVPRKRRGEGVKYQPSGFPRGWHFKIFYKHTDGKCYSKGKLIADKDIQKFRELQANYEKKKAMK